MPCEAGEVGAEGPEAIVVERTAGQSDAAHLVDGSGDEGRVTVSEVDRRVGREHVEVATALDIGDPGTLGLVDHDGDRVVVVRAVLVFELDGLVGRHGPS